MEKSYKWKKTSNTMLVAGDHIQGAFNVSRTPSCPQATLDSSHQYDCGEIEKLHGMAVYFLHNKERSRSYYNLDVRYHNGTQKRVRSRDLPWGMKQVSQTLVD